LFTQQPIPFHPPQISMSSVNPKQAYLWNAPAVTKPTVMSGSPTVRLDVSSSSPSTTLYAYLYDVGADGSATLMTYAPDTTKSGTTTITLHPLSWTVAAGHHVALVVDTVDERYMSAAPSGSTVTLSSSAADPATLSVPAG
jgi:predicted acyl esterase